MARWLNLLVALIGACIGLTLADAHQSHSDPNALMRERGKMFYARMQQPESGANASAPNKQVVTLTTATHFESVTISVSSTLKPVTAQITNFSTVTKNMPLRFNTVSNVLTRVVQIAPSQPEPEQPVVGKAFGLKIYIFSAKNGCRCAARNGAGQRQWIRCRDVDSRAKIGAI